MRPKLGPSEPLVGFVDAGLVVELSARDQRNFVLLFHAIAQGDGERAADLMLENAPQVNESMCAVCEKGALSWNCGQDPSEASFRRRARFC